MSKVKKRKQKKMAYDLNLLLLGSVMGVFFGLFGQVVYELFLKKMNLWLLFGVLLVVIILFVLWIECIMDNVSILEDEKQLNKCVLNKLRRFLMKIFKLPNA